MEPLKLPPSVVSPADLVRLKREVAGLNDFFVAAKAKPAGSDMPLPKGSRSLEALAKENGLNLLDEKARNQLIEQLDAVYKEAPSFHISFAVEASPRSLERILVWLRENIHPQVLLQVGLQPAIAAGCMLRTTNRIFDMSLRKHLNSQTDYLTELIRGMGHGQ